ncbi:MAG: DNA-processing protein DprA [Thermoguttaceae bacterium]
MGDVEDTIADGDSCDQDLIDALRLSLIPGVGPMIRQSLLERFGSARAVLEAAPSQLQTVPGVGPKLMRKITEDAEQIDVQGEIDLCRQHGVEIVMESHDHYPRMLREIHDPPGVLFVRGRLTPEDALAVAVVGTRHGSRYGLRQAEQLGGSLARAGLTVVSGLARGIDSAAHRGALAAGGRTIAVLGSGVLNIYPPEHEELARQVIAQGALLSEAPPLAQPLAGTFPQRNRLISGLSLGVVVVEAAQRSGALITARHAMEQGREVFAVPGQVDTRTAAGCHRLIRDGAKLVETVDDVLEELGPLVEAAPREDGSLVRHPAELQLNELEQKVLAAIGTEATLIDQIVTESGLPVPRVLSTISVLEMRRLVRRLSGSTVARV